MLNTASAHCDKRFKYGENSDIRFMFERIGFSTKMNELEAAVGLGNLDIYDEILNRRRENLYYLIDKFDKFRPYLTTIKKEDHEDIGPHALPIIIDDSARFNRSDLTGHLESMGIDTRTLFSSIPTQCLGFAFLGHKIGDFPNAEYIGKNAIHIGIHQELKQKHCDYILGTMEDFLAGKH